MFTDFEDLWTPVAFASEVGGKPLARVVAGVPVVLFRDRAGKVGALVDRCPHRGVKLSLGSVNEAGLLECPFHGWAFRADGACAAVPWNEPSDGLLAACAATALPVREAGAMVWIWTSTTTAPSGEPFVPEALRDRQDVALFQYSEVWHAHWSRAMENMLDAPHLPFVHRRTIGAQLRRLLPATMTVAVDDTPYGFRTWWTTPGVPRDPDVWLDWYRPNGMGLNIPMRGRLLRQHMYCVPEAEGRVRMMLVSVRGFGVGNPVFGLFDRFNTRILHEDRAIVESSSPTEAPPPGVERSVATDRATLVFRNWYWRHLKRRGEARRGDGAAA